ncbi:hypothetical protein [Pseudooceanicola aestuarii]|uniref:hypothetical protein n=1 Tax=Pseudooceanicola aestuarii TaxID=2697319 RepID=UPI0013D65607|nr:hypothetical protein [Pseudooceanicola aestuarii]
MTHSDTYFDLGPHSRPVTCANAQAQTWFDRGLNWTFGYHHVEAVACFRRAAEADPACAMAHWGVAYASGPNYNLPWKVMDLPSRRAALAVARDAMDRALALADRVQPWEAALIRALPARYPQAEPVEDMRPWDEDYAAAMRQVHQALPEDAEAATIFAEALLNVTPWKMWDLPAGQPNPRAHTVECRQVLETALARPGAMAHPGLLHLYIHLMEMSPEPQAALRAGDALRRLVPDAGHLVHMPTHIDVLCGDYQATVDWNQQAVRADRRWYDSRGGMDFYTGYRQHNYHFVIYGAMFLGQIAPALAANRDLIATTPDEMLRIESPPMADYFESFMGFEPHILIRFGRWAELLALPLPEDQAFYCATTAFVLYGKALAHAALGQVDQALTAEHIFLEAAARVPSTRLMHNNRVVDLLAVARAMLRGEILYRQQDFPAAFDALREAVRLDDTLPYDEPWGWMQPARHALGALLFEQGQVAEAEQVYREDLGLAGDLPRVCIHPDNVWALKGLHDCLEARGEASERPLIRQRLDLALARADVEVAASCFCAQAAMRGCCSTG